MSDTNFRPETRSFNPEDLLQVREHLEQLLNSQEFGGSKRAQEFLRLIVGHALAGDFDSLREREIGSEMFGRPIGYDTANDAVVRVKATEVRRRLTQFYERTGSEWPLRIELPVGAYAPRFVWKDGAVVQPAAGFTDDTSTAEKTATVHGRSDAEPVRPSRRRLIWAVSLASLAVIGVVGQLWRRSLTPQLPIRSIAILPLVNLSGDPQQDYFADGMTEEITTELGQVASLMVISRTSSMTYKGTQKQLPQIARELNVDSIVEGSMQHVGNHVRITTQLIDARTDRHLWSHTYDRDMTSVLDLQTEVARTIAGQVRAALTPREQTLMNRSRQANPEAVDLYLQAAQRLDNGNPADAIVLLRGAIDKDPNYAAAHVSLARAYGWMGGSGFMPYTAAFSLQESEALKAIALDDTSAEPHIYLADSALAERWDWKTEENELKRALEINSNASSAHWAYAFYLSRIGLHSRAIAEASIAQKLDPVSFRSFLNFGYLYYYARQYDQALEQMQKAEALPHDNLLETVFPKAIIYDEKGLYDQSTKEFKRLGDGPGALGHLGNAFARQGRTAEARAILPKLREHVDKEGVGRYEIAIIYAGLGDKDSAFQWLEQAYEFRDKGMTYLKIDPCLDPLRSDPRFRSLLSRVGFPAAEAP